MSDIQAAVIETAEPVTTDIPHTEPTVTTEVNPEPVADVVAPQTYAVKVGDAEQQVTLEDLQSGFMRQADYTRKTQEVASMRQRLAQAESIANSLDSDPEGTLRALAEAFGVGLSGDEGFDPESVDPSEARLRQVEQRLATQAQAEVRAQIDGEINSLLDTHGDFDLQATINHAAQHGMTVTAAYRDLNFDTVATKAAEAERIRLAKVDANVVEGGAHRTGVVADEKPTNNIREAWAAAKKSLGV